MPEVPFISLSELLSTFKEVVEDAFPGTYWVKGEITLWTPRANGHCYLDLSESRAGQVVAQTRAIIWSRNYRDIKDRFETATGMPLKAGITVLVKARVSFSPTYGVSLFIDDIDPSFTLGEKALARKKAIEKLTRLGYMDMQKELCIPDIPRRLAVISSATAAGLQDFINHIEKNPRGYAFDISLFEASVQGDAAAGSVIAALKEIQEEEFDAVLILRGGGSENDLSCFDDYDLAVAIAECPLPVVTAIGHDKDYHIADMVACTYVKTPTALADLFIDKFCEAEEEAEGLYEKVCSAVRERILSENLRVDMKVRAVVTSLMGLHRRYEKNVDSAASRIRNVATVKIGALQNVVSLLETRINSADPRTLLSRGYVLVTGSDNKLLKGVGRVRPGDRIGVRFSDGSVIAHVSDVIREGIENEKVNTA
ncbi:MAG: exodeoxyribonuclease VII large subunit [Bacteroidales bacterium]|nr:exodeoxyribonuclease VII large subunit [Bacteroidales bacterium]